MSVQEMLKRFEETRVSDNTGPPSAPPAPAATRPRAPVTRRTVSFRTAAGPVQPRLRHRNSEGRIGLTRSRPVSAHVSPLLRERPAVLRRNAALKARVSERVGDLERRPSTERAAAAAVAENGSPSPPVVKKAGQANGEVAAVGPAHRPLARVVVPDAFTGARSGTVPVASRAAVVSVPVPPPAAADIDNNNEPLKTGGAHRHTVAAAEELTGEDFSSLPLPPGPPPRKPPRTFAHDVYVQTKQIAGAAGAEAGVAAVSKAGVKAGAGVASGAGKAASAGQGAGAGEVGVEAAAAANGVSTTVAIRRSTSGSRPAVARKPSDLGRRMSSRLETFQPLPSAATAGADAKSPAEHVYAEPTVSRRDRPPPPSPPPPPPPPGRNRRPGPGNARRGPVEPYAVSLPLRRSASDETLYGTLSREHVYELLPNAKTRPVSISSSAGSPPGLRRHPAFKRQERPSLRRIAPGRPPPPAFAREPEGRMGCLLTAVSAEGDADSADPAPAGRRSDRWTAGPLALRRRNYLRRVSTQMGGSRPRVSVGSAERLFDALLVVALSADSEGRLEPCVVSRYPPDVSLEADVAPFCFPDAERWQRAPDVWGRSAADGGAAYTLVVTDERGGRSYGYCRRLTADTGGGAVTLPIAYCLLTRHDAPAFYSKLLTALLEHHGTSEQHRLRVLDELYGRPFPLPGGSLSVPAASCADGQSEKQESNGGSTPEQKPRLVRRPLDPRLEEDGLYLLVRRLGVDLFIKLFSSALLERKIVLYSAHLGVLSAAVSALQAALCPFVWQHCLIPVVPSRLAELLAVPSPFIMGALPETRPLEHLNEQEDVICVDLDAPSLVQSVGDEATILPRRLGRTLAEALRLAACLPGGEPAPGVASVMLAETLLRLFVEVCGHYRVHLTTQQDGRPVLQREAFVESAPSDDVREFLEWFTETAMFAAFIESCDHVPEAPAVSLFDRRVMEQHGDEQAGCHRILRGTKHLKALGGRFKFRLPS